LPSIVQKARSGVVLYKLKAEFNTAALNQQLLLIGFTPPKADNAPRGCTREESEPLKTGLQEQISNHL
jgi:hypothetical protein